MPLSQDSFESSAGLSDPRISTVDPEKRTIMDKG
jgi:hypothetical protein